MSGTKKLFEMTQQASALNAEGRVFDEIVEIIADEWNLDIDVAYQVVNSWWEGKIMRSFNYEEAFHSGY